jgi:hypothetical protein
MTNNWAAWSWTCSIADVYALDVPADKLSVAVIDKYLELKVGGVIGARDSIGRQVNFCIMSKVQPLVY